VKNRLVIEHVVSEFYMPLYRFALALAGSERDAADLTQETFLILCKHKDQVREPDKIKSWLFTTLRRTFLKTLQARRSRPEVELEPKHQALSTVEPTAPRSVDAAAILNALCGLKEDYRVVLELFYLGDLSYQEIATALRIPVGTVMSRLARGKEQLRGVVTKVKLIERSSDFGDRRLRSSR
jgi:RNA polymerase sigma-70 factor, ECF subfamily